MLCAILGCASAPASMAQVEGPREETPTPSTSSRVPASRQTERPPPRPTPPPPPIVVASFNILAGRFGVERVAQAIRALDADLVGLQEVDVGTRRSGGLDLPGELARRTGMYQAFGKAMDFDGGAYGVALLSRTPLSAVRTLALPVVAGGEPRVLLLARTRLKDQDWVLGVSHFSSLRDAPGAASAHRDQARAVAEALGGREGSILLADLNTEASDVALTPLSIVGELAGLDAGPTYPSRQPLLRIDHVVISQDLLAWKSRVVDTGVSDHRALVVEVGRRHQP
ncbi:MAG: endonuclease/exonuclease/phosphatase family protein [Pseudomonadota bacterium]